MFVIATLFTLPLSALLTKYIDIISNKQFYFPFAMPLLVLAITWWMYRREHKDLSALGLNPTLKHLSLLPAGFIVSIIFYGLISLIISLLTGVPLLLNRSITILFLLSGIYNILASVILEELLFRGYCFMKTIEATNVKKAQILFAILFVLYHWINKNLFSQPLVMVAFMVFITLGHFLFSTALLRSGSMYLSIGMHLGWNWSDLYIFGKSSADNTLIYANNDPRSLYYFIIKQVVMILTILLMIFLLRKFVRKV